jgi:hypothetical protein
LGVEKKKITQPFTYHRFYRPKWHKSIESKGFNSFKYSFTFIISFLNKKEKHQQNRETTVEKVLNYDQTKLLDIPKAQKQFLYKRKESLKLEKEGEERFFFFL